MTSNSIFLLVDHLAKKIWIWNGKDSTPRMKFISARKAPMIRDSHGIDYKILSVDQGSETQAFKDLLKT